MAAQYLDVEFNEMISPITLAQKLLSTFWKTLIFCSHTSANRTDSSAAAFAADDCLSPKVLSILVPPVPCWVWCLIWLFSNYFWEELLGRLIDSVFYCIKDLWSLSRDNGQCHFLSFQPNAECSPQWFIHHATCCQKAHFPNSQRQTGKNVPMKEAQRVDHSQPRHFPFLCSHHLYLQMLQADGFRAVMLLDFLSQYQPLSHVAPQSSNVLQYMSSLSNLYAFRCPPEASD